MLKEKIQFSEEDIQKILELSNKKIPHWKIGEIMGVSKSSITRLLNNQGVQLRHIDISKELEAEICKRYTDGESILTLSKEKHLSKERITTLLKNNDIHIRNYGHKTYTLNEEYFKEIDTPNKAYLLGLLYADGSMTHNKNSYMITLTLQEKDKSIIDKFNAEIGSNRKPFIVELSKKNPNHQNSYGLRICNYNFCSYLIDCGVVPNKSLIIDFPTCVPDDLIRHFLRGYMDGDGTIHKTEQRCSLIANVSFCEKLQILLKDVLSIHGSIIYCHDKTKPTRSFSIAGRNQVKKFLDWIYEDADLYIERKYNIYKEVYLAA